MKITKPLISSEEISNRVQPLGQQITSDYENRQLILIGILNGAFIFLADLARAINLDIEVDFIRVASYGNTTSSSGKITLTKKPELDLADKDILLVEDIVDTGTTMAWLNNYLATTYTPASLKICSLIDKKERRQVPVTVDYTGFSLDRGFLVGYGLDCAQKFRNLPEVCSLEEK